ncbi:SDR family oxidoreductase [Candidatus Latescibacterota bacterium]
MHCLVTGGAGFIGSNLVEALLKRGDRVTVLDDLSSGRRENIAPFEGYGRFRFIEGSITNLTTCKKACRGVEAVFHQAAFVNVPESIVKPSATAEINVRGTVNVFEAAHRVGIRAIVWASSTAVYGNTAKLPNVETMPLCPLSPYAASKAAGEMFARVFCEVYGIDIVGLRYFNVYGERQDPLSPYAAVIPRFIGALLKGERVTIFGDGEQTRDFVHVADVVAANLRAAENAHFARGDVYNIGSGVGISVNRLYDIIADELGSSLRPTYAPPRAGDVHDSVADISRAQEAFGYQPAIAFTDGLRQTIRWFQERMREEKT